MKLKLDVNKLISTKPIPFGEEIEIDVNSIDELISQLEEAKNTIGSYTGKKSY